MVNEKRTRGRPGIYETSAERSRAWRDRQKTLTARPNIQTIAAMIEYRFVSHGALNEARQIIDDAPIALRYVRQILSALAMAAAKIPETERMFLKDAEKFFGEINIAVVSSNCGRRVLIKQDEKRKLELMTNAMSMLVKRIEVSGQYQEADMTMTRTSEKMAP